MSPSLGKQWILLAAFLVLTSPGLVSRRLYCVMCVLSSGDKCGARGHFPHHLLILMRRSFLTLLLSACLGLSVRVLDRDNVELRSHMMTGHSAEHLTGNMDQ